jgi:hypothetical protein
MNHSLKDSRIKPISARVGFFMKYFSESLISGQSLTSSSTLKPEGMKRNGV